MSQRTLEGKKYSLVSECKKLMKKMNHGELKKITVYCFERCREEMSKHEYWKK